MVTRRQAEKSREAIKVGKTIERLEKIANGDVTATAQQIKANEILLKTALPALSSTEITEHKAKFDPKEAIKELAMLIKDNPELAREMNGVLNPPKPRLVVENA